MSWMLAEDWLTAVGLVLIVVATVAQARSELAEYRTLLTRYVNMLQAMSDAGRADLAAAVGPVFGRMLGPFAMAAADMPPPRGQEDGLTRRRPARQVRASALLTRPYMPAGLWLFWLWLAIWTALATTPRRLAQIRAADEQAAGVARLSRSAAAWSVLMAGSVLAMAASFIHLALALAHR